MSFVSIAFLCLYCAALLLRFGAGSQGMYRGGLLALSLCFYAWHVPAYLGLILASTATDFVAGRWLRATPAAERGKRRVLLVTSVAVNLGLLGYFKYAGFLLAGVEAIKSILGI